MAGIRGAKKVVEDREVQQQQCHGNIELAIMKESATDMSHNIDGGNNK